jgi:hypothetical protein
VSTIRNERGKKNFSKKHYVLSMLLALFHNEAQNLRAGITRSLASFTSQEKKTAKRVFPSKK